MNSKTTELIKKFFEQHSLNTDEYEYLLTHRDEELTRALREEAVALRKKYYGNKVFIRGLIEISNICKNDCYYCGIRKSNKNCDRYRLTEEDILSCCETGYNLGFRTFVLQGGEDGYFTDEIICNIVKEIKIRYQGCAITLSLGERSKESYNKLFLAGADRYLLRHETADENHYSMLHPANLTLANRMKCLDIIKKAGFQVGCGFMVGSPFQNASHIAKDLKFIEEFKPDMCGIGPFISHNDTPFRNEKSGTVDFTCFLLSIIRIIHPKILLPSTTALGTLEENGREKGISASANVVMPNLSPVSIRDKYMLYNNKLNTGAESAEKLNELIERIESIGYRIVFERGDVIK